MSASEDRSSDFELIREALLRLDPVTRAETIEAMRVFRALPRPVAVRVLLNATARAQLRARQPLLSSPS